MAVLHESTFDRLAIHSALAPVVQRLLLVDPVLVPDMEALAFYGQREDDAFDAFDECARLPHRGRRAAVEAAGVAGVGGGQGGLQVRKPPQGAAALLPRLMLGSLFQRADRRFDG